MRFQRDFICKGLWIALKSGKNVININLVKKNEMTR